MRSILNTIRYRITYNHKNSKFLYYLSNYAKLLIPRSLFTGQLENRLNLIEEYNEDNILRRVNYYNKLTATILPADVHPINQLGFNRKPKVYFFDTIEYLRYFNPVLRCNFLFGDVTTVPATASIVKSRPIQANNSNSVLLKLNKVRHFIFVNDKIPFRDKKNMLVGRGKIARDHRIRFYEQYFGHPLCNLGQTHKKIRPEWVRDWLTIDQQLQYKFILCLEGNDVASNLKWVMSSNSLAVMPEPKYETWFMEGTLIPNYHYVLIKDDYSDLEERLRFYMDHPAEALQIILNAHRHVNQFRNKEREDLISLMTLQKYFECTGQVDNTRVWDIKGQDAQLLTENV